MISNWDQTLLTPDFNLDSIVLTWGSGLGLTLTLRKNVAEFPQNCVDLGNDSWCNGSTWNLTQNLILSDVWQQNDAPLMNLHKFLLVSGT